MDERWLTADEVAEHLRVDPETVRRWLRAGKLRGFLISQQAGYRVAESELQRFIEERMKRPVATDSGFGDDEWLTVGQVATVLRVSPETVRRWLRAGRIEAKNFSGRTGWRVQASEVRRMLEIEFRA